jgi:uncharacterized membrane protein YeaQ/YmgE (transglycosylase-associated protein family)
MGWYSRVMLAGLIYLNIFGWFIVGLLCGLAVGIFTMATDGLTIAAIPAVLGGILGAFVAAMVVNMLTGFPALGVTLYSLLAAVVGGGALAFIAKSLSPKTQII